MQGKDLQPLQDRLTATLSCRPNMLVGCARQNSLQRERQHDTTWRLIRGNAVLHAMGNKIEVEYPFGFFDAYVRQATSSTVSLLQFRGGRWKPWWNDDAQMVAACVDVFTAYEVSSIILFQELEGILTANLIELAEDHEAMVEAAVNMHTEVPVWRIPKNEGRGMAWCQHCTVRNACDGIDLEYGQTGDWSKKGASRGR